jgi:hypothetical protein
LPVELSVQESFGRVLTDLWARDGIVADEPQLLASTVAASFAAGGAGISVASDLLVRTGVGNRWNEVLRRGRAAALAARIRPLVAEPLLDVLAGDGSVCRALLDLGVKRLAATERCGDYPESILPPDVPFQPFADSSDLANFGASTALLSAVLHHEPNPVHLLDALVQAEIPRWIVVENCVTPEFSRAFHEFADRFFNNCLNQFGVHCGDQHRTLDEWADLLTRYGTVSVIDEGFTVPGIPFPYSLLVVTARTPDLPANNGA